MTIDTQVLRAAANEIDALRADRDAYRNEALKEAAAFDAANAEVARLRDAERHARMDAELHWAALVEARAEVARLWQLQNDYSKVTADLRAEVARLRAALIRVEQVVGAMRTESPRDALREAERIARAALGEGT